MGVTPFDEFRRLKDQQEDEGRNQEKLESHNAACGAYADLVRYLEETARLVEALDHETSRALAKAIAEGEVAEREDLRKIAYAYERLSWRLCGQLRAILDGIRKS
jgi:hypothetical protein|tara:strand:+ start:60 stop:374 length:315 start_codon:yes stop_codon:yes gene_type:complete